MSAKPSGDGHFSLDARGGIAGDMFSAVLVSAGADSRRMTEAMEAAATKLGRGHIRFAESEDGAVRAVIRLESQHSHMNEVEAREHVEALLEEFDLTPPYSRFARDILEILLRAEKEAHRKFSIHVDGGHTHHHHDPDITFLHEAQDIVIDIIGAAFGLQLLRLPPETSLHFPVAVGGGTVTFSHGTLTVPAPATRVILETHKIPWQHGPIDRELCTPTGAAILAALRARVSPSRNHPGMAAGSSRGSRSYDIPPLKLFF